MINHISLGGTCAIAYQLNKCSKREKSFPFDWAKTDIKQLITVLEENFKDYEKIQIKKLSENHPHNDTEEPSYILVNKYKITMAHEVIKNTEVEDFTNKLIRRIARFKKLEEKVIFYRLETNIYKSSYDDNFKKLIEILNSYTIDYEIRLIVHNSYKKSSIFSDKLKIYYYDEFLPDWKFDNLDWCKIFK